MNRSHLMNYSSAKPHLSPPKQHKRHSSALVELKSKVDWAIEDLCSKVDDVEQKLEEVMHETAGSLGECDKIFQGDGRIKLDALAREVNFVAQCSKLLRKRIEAAVGINVHERDSLLASFSAVRTVSMFIITLTLFRV